MAYKPNTGWLGQIVFEHVFFGLWALEYMAAFDRAIRCSPQKTLMGFLWGCRCCPAAHGQWCRWQQGLVSHHF